MPIAAVVAVALTLNGGRDPQLLPAVAVLPFTNETGESALDPVARSASDWVAHGLIRTGFLRVATPGATVALAATVDGRLYGQGDTLWLQPRVLRPGGELAAVLDPVAAPVANPTAALEPVRKQVLATLGLMFDPRITTLSETALRPPVYEAYVAFAAAYQEYYAGQLESALAGFAEAAALDPDYAQPRLWQAVVSTQLGRYSTADSILAALKPLAADLSPLDRAWLERLYAHVRGEHEYAFIAARRMVDLAPGPAWTYALVATAMDTRRFAYARDALVALTPDSLGVERPTYWWILAWLEHMLGDHRSELTIADAGIRADGRWWPNLLARTRALAALGESEALEEILDELLVNTPREPVWGVRQRRDVWSMPWMSLSDLPHLLALELRRHGHPEAANRLLGKRIAFHRDPKRGAPPVSQRQLAGLLYEHGEHTQADSIARVMLADTTDPVFPRGMLGLLAASRGDRAEAERWARELARVERPYVFGDHTLWRAQIAAKLGDDAESIELLRQASAEGIGRGGWWWVHVLAEFGGAEANAVRRNSAPRLVGQE